MRKFIKFWLVFNGIMVTNILYTLTFIILFIASYTDFKKREVPDMINYGFLFSILGIRAIYSVYSFDYWYFVDGLIGGLIFFIVACAMFYAGQWGGGDSKMIMGLGALFGFSLIQWNEFQLIELFLINALIIGGVYGLIYSIVLAVKHWHNFKQKFKAYSKQKKIIKMKIISIIICALLFILSFFLKDFMLRIITSGLIIFLILTIYFYLFAKSVEESAMLKYVNVAELTEGDWIVNDIVIDGKRITGPKDLGIEMKQIEELKTLEKLGKIDKILIKIGIPFVPSFMVSFLVVIFFGNWFVWFV